MESRIPLPTDNIFKFYAFFGLLLLIFSIGSTLYVTQSNNDFIFEIAVEYNTLNADLERSVPDEARFQILDRVLEVRKNDKAFFKTSLSIIGAVGLLMALYGFRKWHSEIQPLQDEIARLSLKKLQIELSKYESKQQE